MSRKIGMKILKLKLLGLIVCALVAQKLVSQEVKLYNPTAPQAFFGAGFGINDYGIGLGAEHNIVRNFWLYGVGGISTWGYRLTGGLTYYPQLNGYNTSFSVGYSFASGEQDYVTELEVKDYYSTQMEKVTLDLLPIKTINIMYGYNLLLSKRCKLVFNGGYAFCLTDKIFVNKTKYLWRSAELTKGSEDFVALMAPGGVIVGLKLMIGG